MSQEETEKDQLSFHYKTLISGPNYKVKMAYESPIIPLSKQRAVP